MAIGASIMAALTLPATIASFNSGHPPYRTYLAIWGTRAAIDSASTAGFIPGIPGMSIPWAMSIRSPFALIALQATGIVRFQVTGRAPMSKSSAAPLMERGPLSSRWWTPRISSAQAQNPAMNSAPRNLRPNRDTIAARDPLITPRSRREKGSGRPGAAGVA